MTSGGAATPPRLARRLLDRRLHADERDELIGDLDEHFAREVGLRGLGRARRWYWRQAIGLAWGFAFSRRDLVSTSHERIRGRWAAANVVTDARYAWRSLRASRGFAVVALLTLTVGIGLSTAVFSIVDGILLRPLPYPSADRIVRLAESSHDPIRGRFAAMHDSPTKTGLSDVAIGVFIDDSETLEAITPVDSNGMSLATPHGAVQVQVGNVGAGFFSLIGARPVIGRLFDADDGLVERPAVAVVSESFWRNVLDGREDVLGSALVIEGTSRTIVGVAPSAIDFPESGIAVWTAFQQRWPAPGGRRMFGMSVDVVARLKPGVTLHEAQAEAQRVARRIAMADPAFSDATADVSVIRVRRLLDDIVAPVHAALVALLTGMGLVLAAACVNLANLLLARSTARQREIAVRLALGATRWRIVRPLLLEQLVLALGGAAAGGLLALWILHALPAIAPANLPRLADVRFNTISLVFATAAALMTALVVGLLPAWQMARGNLRDLASAGRVKLGARSASADAFRRVLVMLQIALASALLVGAVLIGRSLTALLRVNPGYQPGGALTFQVGLPEGWYKERGREGRLFEGLRTRLAQHPSVTSVGMTSSLPLLPIPGAGTFFINGRPRPVNRDEFPVSVHKSITPGLMRALGTRVVRGRDFRDTDTIDAERVSLVDEELVRQYFPNEDPIGQKIEWTVNRVWTVVGIVESVHQGRVSSAVQPTLYIPAAQLPGVLAFNTLSGGFVVRTSGDPLDLVATVRSIVKEQEPDSPVFNVMRLDDRLDLTFAAPRFYAIVLGLFACLALSTAVLGVYGVLSFAVERRRMEFGVRRALGAGASHIATLVLRQSLWLCLVGLGTGLLLAAFSGGLVRSLLFGIQPLDPWTFAGSAVVIVGVALAASWHPARQALRIDPAQSLRIE